jgi:hypothetical protein
MSRPYKTILKASEITQLHKNVNEISVVSLIPLAVLHLIGLQPEMLDVKVCS